MDVQDPDLLDVVAGLPEGETAVVVPLLLSVGYHVKVDIARAVEEPAGQRWPPRRWARIRGWRSSWTSGCARPA